jgi:hypothetical protein
MQILESQLRQHVKLLLKEEVYGTIATVYHGSTQPPEEFLKIFETGDASSYASTSWKAGKGAGSLYGHGLYSVWMKTSHQTFKGNYGEWIYKLKVNLHGFIIFDEEVCKKVYGKSITPLEQMKLIGKERELKSASKEELEALSNPPVKNERSAGLAQETSNFLKGRVNGIVFFGSNDGPVVLIYDPDIVTPLAWTKLDKKTKNLEPWKSWNASEIKQSLKRASNAGAQAKPTRLQSNFKIDIEKLVNNEALFNKVYFKLSDSQKEKLATKAINENILQKLSDDPLSDIRVAAALNKNSLYETRLKLSKDEDPKVRESLAANPKIELKLLAELASDPITKVRLAVVNNKKVNTRILSKFINEQNDDIRWRVSLQPKAPLEILEAFINDENLYTRANIAGHENVSADLLRKLSDDLSFQVRAQVAQNKSTPTDILMNYAESGRYDYDLLINPSLTTEMLMKLIKSGDSNFRELVATSKSVAVTIDVLRMLSTDASPYVRKAAVERIEEIIGV